MAKLCPYGSYFLVHGEAASCGVALAAVPIRYALTNLGTPP